jgi:hypothetical protein
MDICIETVSMKTLTNSADCTESRWSNKERIYENRKELG